MKKIIAVVCLICVLTATITGCKNTETSELKKYVDEIMFDAEECMDVLKAGTGNWDRYASDEKIVESIQKITLPQTEKAIELLKKVDMEKESNINLINLYINALEIYSEGQQKMIEAIDAGDEQMRGKAKRLIEQADRVYDKYNNALERQLAKEKIEIEYDK